MFTQSDQKIGDKKSFFNPDFSVYSYLIPDYPM